MRGADGGRADGAARRRVRAALALGVALAALALAACGGGEGGAARELDFSARAVGEAFDPAMQPQVVNSALAVGPNRIVVGLFNAERELVQDAEGVLRLYRLGEDDRGTLEGEYPLRRASIAMPEKHAHDGGEAHGHEEPFATVYVVRADLPAAGRWGVALAVDAGGQRRDPLLASPVTVLERTPEPGIGDPLPASAHLTLRDVDDPSEVSSAPEPIAALNELTVAEALATGQPVLVAVATPAFCQSRFCGPLLDEVVYPLYGEFADRVAFVHVEPFSIPEAREGRLVAVPLMAEWRLLTEPWIFVAGRDGRVAAKFEGIASIEEVRETLAALVAEG